MDDRLISPRYVDLNMELHQRSDGYGSSAGRLWAQHVADLAREVGAETVIDYGCGKATLKPALRDIAPDLRVREYDPAVFNKQAVPRQPVDLVVCLDVLEHVETDKVAAVVEHLASLAKSAVFATVCTRPASEHKLLADGTNPHATVRPLSWWIRRLGKRFSHVEWHGHGNHEYVIIARP